MSMFLRSNSHQGSFESYLKPTHKWNAHFFSCTNPFKCTKEIITIFKFTIHFITCIHALRDINFYFTKRSENYKRYCQCCLICHHIQLGFVALLWYNQLLTSSAFWGLVSFALKILSMLSDLSSYSPWLGCIVVIQPVAHIISIQRLGFICFISYCPICHTITPKGSRLSCNSSGGQIPGSHSCHSGSSTAYSVGQGKPWSQQWWKLQLPPWPKWLQLGLWYSGNSVEVDLHGQYQ